MKNIYLAWTILLLLSVAVSAQTVKTVAAPAKKEAAKTAATVTPPVQPIAPETAAAVVGETAVPVPGPAETKAAPAKTAKKWTKAAAKKAKQKKADPATTVDGEEEEIVIDDSSTSGEVVVDSIDQGYSKPSADQDFSYDVVVDEEKSVAEYGGVADTPKTGVSGEGIPSSYGNAIAAYPKGQNLMLVLQDDMGTIRVVRVSGSGKQADWAVEQEVMRAR